MGYRILSHSHPAGSSKRRGAPGSKGKSRRPDVGFLSVQEFVWFFVAVSKFKNLGNSFLLAMLFAMFRTLPAPQPALPQTPSPCLVGVEYNYRFEAIATCIHFGFTPNARQIVQVNPRTSHGDFHPITTHKPTNQPTNQPTHQPTHPPTTHTTNQPTHPPTTHPPTTHPLNRSTDQPINRSTDQPTNQPINQPTTTTNLTLVLVPACNSGVPILSLKSKASTSKCQARFTGDTTWAECLPPKVQKRHRARLVALAEAQPLLPQNQTRVS